MLLKLTKCSSYSGWRNTSKLCSSLLAETKLKHLQRASPDLSLRCWAAPQTPPISFKDTQCIPTATTQIY